MNRSYREPIESDFIVSVTENDNISELEDDCSLEPVVKPTEEPLVKPIEESLVKPIEEPPVKPTEVPVVTPTEESLVKPIEEPPVKPTEVPVVTPTEEPAVKPTEVPAVKPTEVPAVKPTEVPAVKPTEEPAVKPTEVPAVKPTEEPLVTPTEVLVETIFEPTEINENIREPIVKICDEVIPKKTVVFSETIIKISEKNPTEVDNYVNALDPALSKFAYYLSPQEFIIIQKFVIDPDATIISQIKQCVKNIMTEEVIQLHDIPNFILSISQIFTSNFIAIKNINVTNIIKYTLDSLMEYNVLEFKGDKTISKSLIETSFNLLKTSIVKNKSKKIFSSIFSCFK
jgi:hypothetical protein